MRFFLIVLALTTILNPLFGANGGIVNIDVYRVDKERYLKFSTESGKYILLPALGDDPDESFSTAICPFEIDGMDNAIEIKKGIPKSVEVKSKEKKILKMIVNRCSERKLTTSKAKGIKANRMRIKATNRVDDDGV